MLLNPLCITWQEYNVIIAFCVCTFESSVMCHILLREVVWNGSRGTDLCGWRGSYQKIAEERVSMCWERVFKSLPRSDKLWRLMVWLNLQKWLKWQKPAEFVQSHQYTVAPTMGCITQTTSKKVVAAVLKDANIIHTPLSIFHTYREGAGTTVALQVVGLPFAPST